MSFGCYQVRRHVIHQYEIAVNKNIVSYLESRVRVMNAGAFEQGRVTHDGCFLVAHLKLSFHSDSAVHE
jgi:hypothetical protein